MSQLTELHFPLPCDLLTHLTPDSPSAITRSGGNSTVTCITVGGTAYALKDYSGRTDGGRRMGREFAALSFLHPRLPHWFARPLAMSTANRQALHSWLPGTPALLDHGSLAALLALLSELHEARGDPWSSRLPQGTDAVTGPREISAQIDQRLATLDTRTSPSLREAVLHLQRALPRLSPRDPAPAAASRTLSLSDAGAHNLLVDRDRYRCVDCEFFGWDDPHKLVGDCLLHPRADWNSDLATRFLSHVTTLYALDESRLMSFYSWLAAKWVTIVLARLERMAGSNSVNSGSPPLEDPDVRRLLAILHDPPMTYAALVDSASRRSVPA